MITIKANAKINLTLDILRKRDDGYHEVSMVMQSISLHDVLTFTKLPDSDKIVLHGDVKGVAKPEDNLVYKAVDLFLRTYKIKDGVEINLQKNIPVAAGLAGGSTDAGAVFRGLNKLFQTNLSLDEMCEMGAKLGSDIPFCIVGGTMLAQGRGEILQKLPSMPITDIVLVKPKIDVSTAWVYKNYHTVEKNVLHPDNAQMKVALANQDTKAICRYLGNVLENVTIPVHQDIMKIKQALCAHGAYTAMMSGSGPTVFAIVKDKATAEKIAEKMRGEFDADVFTAKTTTANEIEEMK